MNWKKALLVLVLAGFALVVFAVDGDGRFAVIDDDRHRAVDVAFAVEVAAGKGGRAAIGAVDRPADFPREVAPAAFGADEVDHLDGKLFVDYLSPLKRSRIRKKLEKQHKLDRQQA